MRRCNQPDCGRPHAAHGLCQAHYKQLRNGTQLARIKSIWDEVAYSSAHARVYRAWGAASKFTCIKCGERARDWSYDGTDPTELFGVVQESAPFPSYVFYSRYPEFYIPLCGSCHSKKDRQSAAQELREYREWRYRTGKTLADVS